MREVKFRAWNKAKNRMEYDVYKEYDNLMQYTGLKDKNDKEIYEGDIIELGCGRGIVNIGECDFQTYGSMNQYSCICVYVEYFNFEKEILRKESKFEIIGNIYENPELAGD